MSIFSSLRKSRQQAKEHNAKAAEQKKKEEATVPYKHVPTHAATDAFASAPPSWREADRPRILEQNRRRSSMMASGHHMNMPGVPRVGSSLSRVSYPGQGVSPMVRMSRAHSYVGVSPYPAGARDSQEIMYSAPDVAYLPQLSLKGKEVPRAYDPQRISPASSKGEPSPVESFSGSNSSQDELEMKPCKPTPRTPEGGTAHRLHPSHARRKSDASVSRHASPSPVKTQHTSLSRDSRPPPSTRGFGHIPASASVPPVMAGILPGSLSSQHLSPQHLSPQHLSPQHLSPQHLSPQHLSPQHLSPQHLSPQHLSPQHATATGQSGGSTPSPTNTLAPSSRQGSASSLVGLSHTTTTKPAAAANPLSSTSNRHDHSWSWAVPSEPASDFASSAAVGNGAGSSDESGAGMAYAGRPQPGFGPRQPAKPNRQQDTGLVKQNVWGAQDAVTPPPRVDHSRMPPLAAPEHLVNVFPEEAGYDVMPPPGGDNKVHKSSGGRLVKKKKAQRWSNAKTPAVAA